MTESAESEDADCAPWRAGRLLIAVKESGKKFYMSVKCHLKSFPKINQEEKICSSKVQ